MAASSFKDAAGNIFLLGNNFELGISPDGNFGTSDAPPAGYHTGVGETQVGMVYNPTGFSAAHNATNVDFFLPGTPLELFSVGYTHGGTTSVGTNYYIGSNKATPGGAGSLHEITNVSSTNTSTGNTLSATYVGLFNANLQVTITYSFNVNDLYYSANITLKNIGGTPMNDARYLRMVNPDNTTDYTGNYNTVNTINSQQPGSGASLVLAQNPTPDSWQTATGSPAIFGYYSTDPNTRVSILSGLPSTTNNSALSPFNSGFYATAPAVATSTNANDTIVIDYDAGTLAAGASKSFNYSSLLTNNVAATVAAINSNTPPTFTGGVNTGLTLAENAPTTTISNAMLTVVDAQQGATLLTYTVTTTPTKGTLTRSGVTLTANATFTQADINNGLIQYTPTTGVNGSDSLIFDVSDGAGGVLSAQTFNLTITAPPPPVVVNHLPVAVDDSGSATEAGGNNNGENASPATGNVLTNDTDVDGRALSVSAIRTGNIEGSGTAGTVGQVIAGNYGNLTLNTNGSYTYIVNDSNSTVQSLKLGDTLTESFNYTVFDSLLTDTGVLTITINGSNDSPSVANLNGDSSVFWLGSNTPVLLDIGQNAIATDLDTTNYNNTTILVSFAPGSLGSGVFSVDGTTVLSGSDSTIGVGELIFVSGVSIGTVTANSKASNGLAISLNANATATSIQTLLQNLYYIENSSDTTGAGDRIFNVQINEPNTTAMTPAVVKLTEKIPVPSLSLATDTGMSATDAITNSGVVNVSGFTSNATWQYSADNGVNWAAGNGTTFTLTGDGNKSVIVRQIDAVGNVGLNSSALVFTLDATIATPSLALVNDTGNSTDAITSDGRVAVSNLETGASWQYSQDGGMNWTTGSGSSFNLTGDGNKSVMVRQTDVAGNISSNSNTLNFTLDTSVATPTLTLADDTGISSSDAITNNGLVTVSNLENGATWQYSDSGIGWITGSGTNFTLTGDGAKSVAVSQTDVAGNISSISNTLNFTLDTSVATPALTLTNDTGSSNSDGITNDGTVSVANLETGASWQYSQDGGTNWTAGSGSTFTLTGDGAKSVLVRQTDVAGNVSPNGALMFTLDTSVATPTLTLTHDTGNSNTDGITNNGTVSVANLETGANWQYSQDGGTNWAAGSGSTFTLTGDGAKSVLVRQTDIAGNLSPNGALTFTLDTSVNVPILTLANDTGNSNTDNITNDGTVSVANLETGANWQYSQDGGTNWAAGSGSTFTLTGDGAKSVLVRQTDIAGNLSPNGALTFTLDTSVNVPILTLANDTGNSNTDNITNDGTVSVANLETGANWQYSQDGGTNWAAGSGSTFTLTGDGAKSVLVRQTDIAGNLSPNGALTFTLDTSVNVPILTLANDTGNSDIDNITNNGTVSVANLETGANWQYSQDGGTNWAAGSGSTFTLTGDGAKSVLVRQTDIAGNLSPNGALTFTLDTSVNVPILTLANDTGNSNIDNITNNGTVSVANLETGASWQYSQDGGTNWAAGSGSSFTLTGDGTKSVLVRQTDVAGNVSSNSNALNFTLDTSVAAPILTLTHDTGISNSDGITRDGTVSVANLEAGASWQYSQDGGTNWITGSGSSFTLTGDGTKSVLVRQTDIAGNLSANGALTFNLDTNINTPVLTLINDTGRSNTDGITRDGSVSVANLETGARWQYSQDGGVNWTTGSGSSFTLTGDGYKSVMVRQTDIAGNTSLNSSALTFTLKSTESTPILTLNNDTGSQNNDRITSNGVVNISDLTNAVSWQYSLDNGNNWTVGSGSSFVLYGDGNKSVIAQKMDAAGNVSTSDALNFTLDTSAMTLALALELDTGKNNDNITSDGTVIVSGIENGASWQYSQDGGINWTKGSGTSFTLVGDGDKSVLVEQTDVAGNNSSRSSFNFTLDSTVIAPTLTLTDDTGIGTTDRITNNGSVNVAGLENGASWEYSVDNGKNWIAGNGTSFTLTGDGNKSVTTRQTDIAGNISSNSAPLNFILDQSVSAPALTLNTDTGNPFDSITSDGTVNVSGLENGAVWQYSTDNGSVWKLGSGTSLKLTGDGNKSVIVHQTDAAGNISPNSINLNFTLDSIALPPQLSLENDTGNSNTDAITRDGRVNVSNLENGANWQYSQDGGVNWITGQGNGFMLTGDGYKSVVVRQSDIAGNISANSDTLNFTLDTNVIAPSLALLEDTGDSNTDAITNNGTVSVSGIENGASWQYSIDNGANWIIGQGNSFTLTGDGYKSAVVRQMDAAGNISTNSSPLNFTLDTLAVTPTLTLINDTGNSSTDGITNDSRISVSNLENGANWQYSTDNGVNWITGIGNILALAGDGIKSVIARQIDVAGNISSNSQPLNFTLDTTVKTPQLALINDTGSSNTDGITRDGSVSVSNLENGESWQYSQDGGLNWTAGNGNSFALFGEGKKSVMVRQTDVAGNMSLNSSTLTFNLQNTESTPILALNNDTGSQANDRITRDGTVAISDLKNAVSWRYSVDNENTWTVGGSDNNWSVGNDGSFTLSGDGNKSVIAQKTDAAGNISTSNVFNFTLDTTAAELSLALKNDTGINNDYITSDGTVTVSGIEGGATWQYSQDNGANWTDGSGTSFTLIGDGNKSVIVRQTDVAGNSSKNSQPLNFTLNSSALSPTLKLAQDTGSSNTDKITSNGMVNVYGLENGASWEYSQDGGVSWITGNGTSFTLTGDGNKSVVVRQTDTTGNISTNSAPLNFTLEQSATAPVLTLNADTGSSNTDKITSDGNIHISGLENGATWQYSNDAGKNWVTGNSTDLTVVGDGDKSIIARQIDVAGNTSANSMPLNFTLETSVTAPILALKNDTRINNDKITSDGTVVVTNLAKNASWEYSLDNGANWITGHGNGSITLTGDGNKSIMARQTDVAGNVSTTSAPLHFVLDSTVAAPILTLKNDTGYSNTDKITSDGTVIVSGLENGASWEYSQDDGTTWKTGSGDTITLTGDGNKSILAKETDIAGNISDTAKFAFTLRSIESKFNADVKNLIETDSILTTSGKLTGTNTDKTTIAPQTTVGKYGTFDIDQTGSWHYSTSSPHNEFLQDNVYVDSFPVITSDGQKTSVTIDITGTKDLPIVIDDLTRRSIKQVVINGAPQNVLYGQLGLQSAQGKDIVQNADKSWTSLDLTPVTFNLDKGQVAGKDAQGHTLLKLTLPNGSTMTLNTWDGSYVYVSSSSSSTTDTTDIFNFSADGVPLVMSLNRYDFLDLDGIPDNVETNLANLATAADAIKPAVSGDSNNDGIADKFQGAVADIAWISYADFKAALDNKLSSPKSVINIVVASDNSGKVDNSAQLSNIEVLPSNSTVVGGSKPQSKQISAPWDPLQFSVGAGTADGLKDIDPTRPGTQTLVLIDIARAGVSDFNGYMKYISADTINAYKAAGLPLITLDGEKLTSATQAGWYDYTQRTKGGDGAWFIKDAAGKITKIAMIMTDNSFGDDNLAGNEITDPGLPIIANPPIVPTPPSDNTLKSDTDVSALPAEFNNLILQDSQIDKTVTKTELVDNPLLCLPQWTQKLLNVPAKINQTVTTTEKVVAPLNGAGNELDNQITGNSANNILKGLGGADTLTGGDGADTFVYLDKSDSPATNFDSITDFNVAQGDKIDLSAVDANSNLAGKQTFTYLGTANFTGQAGQLRFDPLSHMLLGDTQGSGSADFAIQLLGVSTLPAEALITKSF